MAEHITHVGAFEDAARLVLHAEALSAPLAESLTRHYDIALCTTSSRGNHQFAVPLLEEVRARYRRREGQMSAYDEQLVAASLGWLAHRAVDHKLDDDLVPRLEALREEEGLSEDEVNIVEQQIYEDALVFREVYDSGRREPRSPHEPFSPATLAEDMRSHPGAARVSVAGTELLFGALWQRNLLGLHAFSSREHDPERWMDAFFERRQPFEEDLRKYTAAFQNPDPEKERRYFEAINTYAAADPLIRLARALQTGEEPLPEVDVEEAVAAASSEESGSTEDGSDEGGSDEDGSNADGSNADGSNAQQSAYARALAQAYRNMRGASDYFGGAIEKDELYDLVEVYPANRF